MPAPGGSQNPQIAQQQQQQQVQGNGGIVEWQEFVKVSRQHFQLISSSSSNAQENQNNNAEAQEEISLPPALLQSSVNPAARVYTFNQTLLFDLKQKSTAVLSAVSQQASSKPTDQFSIFQASTMLSYHGHKVKFQFLNFYS
jgi:hypothetical protein